MEKSPKPKYDYTAIPMDTINTGVLKDLTGNEFKVLFLLIARSQNFTKEAYGTMTTICKDTGLSRQVVINSLQTLQGMGFIKERKNGVANKNVSYFRLSTDWVTMKRKLAVNDNII